LNASFIAQRQLEVVRTIGFANLTNQTETSFADPLLSELNTGTANYSVADYDADGDSTPETDIKEITVEVNWIDGGLTQTYTLTGLISQTGLFR
ncbi:MAG TPA: hypothetical protein VEA37_07565, partial [Flavobacterium sp.]|nr:hypothetical protein [Flavobacterium sp.]